MIIIMAANSMQFTTTCISSLFVILIFFSPLTSSSPDAFCDLTPFPSFCKSILSHAGSATTIYDFSRTSLQLSLWSTKAFLTLLDGYLKILHGSSTTVQALQDCLLLAELNVDFLSNALETISSTSTTLPASEADDLHTFLSATITNQETCFEGLRMAILSSTIRDVLFPKLSNGSMLDSVSLALFKHGWVGNDNEHDQNQLVTSPWLVPKEFKSSDVIVNQKVKVNPNGSGNFTTIGAAVAAAPNVTGPRAAGQGYYVIYVVAGVYQEYVTISKQQHNVMMIGEGINKTIITGDHSVGGGSTTFKSATFAVLGRGFIAVNMTFRNTAGPVKHQAVAVRNGADESVFYKCSFEGYQDTLYTHSLRQFYKECDVYGTVDFIFGDAAAVFQNCNIYVRLPMKKQFNAITAQGRKDLNQKSGIVIQFCSIRAAPDMAPVPVGTVKTFLGRPWRKYSRTVFTRSTIDGLIDPRGWKEWEGDFAINTLYYAEHKNTGAGAGVTQRVKWPGYHVITDRDANNFTVMNFLRGKEWLPATQVPFVAGLK